MLNSIVEHRWKTALVMGVLLGIVFPLTLAIFFPSARLLRILVMIPMAIASIVAPEGGHSEGVGGELYPLLLPVINISIYAVMGYGLVRILEAIKRK